MATQQQRLSSENRRRGVSPAPERVSLGPLEVPAPSSTEFSAQAKSIQTPSAEAPLSLQEYIEPRIFKQLPSIFSAVPTITYGDLATFSTISLISRPTLFTIASLTQSMLIKAIPTDYNRILHLWALRIASVSLLGFPAIAESEAHALIELNTNENFRTKSGASIIPWGLRVLVIKVQTQQHPQVGVVKYYALAREARVECWKLANKIAARKGAGAKAEKKAAADDDGEDKPSETSTKDETEVAPAKAVLTDADDDDENDAETTLEDLESQYSSWCDRLLQCGLFVSSMLSRMRDFGAAFDHISAMLDSAKTEHDRTRVIQIMALLCVEAGDASRASEWFAQLPNFTADPILDTPTTEIKNAVADAVLDDSLPSAAAATPAINIEPAAAKSPTSPTSRPAPAERDALFDNNPSSPTTLPSPVFSSISTFPSPAPTPATASSSATQPQDSLSSTTTATSSSPSPAQSITSTIAAPRVKLTDQPSSQIDSSSKCNLAIANLYDGNIDMARNTLSELLSTGYRFTDLVYNFCVFCNLKTEIDRIAQFK
ncbi:hypothetical protein BZA70DRAFT_308961 [Myxozyma melibiosi]|uniref:Uncharacterized protein n=1 Tax=Myxozyma melibiosi TaxID=54550 RepID=A0ABR1FFS4_9ASCO